jgi:hypothetical protein
MSYRVVYGETMPSWERTFPSRSAARAFAKEHKSLGDRVFSIGKVVPGEKPQSLAAAIEADDVNGFVARQTGKRAKL